MTQIVQSPTLYVIPRQNNVLKNQVLVHQIFATLMQTARNPHTSHANSLRLRVRLYWVEEWISAILMLIVQMTDTLNAIRQLQHVEKC